MEIAIALDKTTWYLNSQLSVKSDWKAKAMME
jgi:hypothetical protein